MIGQIPCLPSSTDGGGQAKLPASAFQRVDAILRIPACPVWDPHGGQADALGRDSEKR